MKTARIALVALVLVAGCRTTPEEIRRIQVENELLREQVRIIRKNCSYYRDLELEAEDPAEPAPVTRPPADGPATRPQ